MRGENELDLKDSNEFTDETEDEVEEKDEDEVRGVRTGKIPVSGPQNPLVFYSSQICSSHRAKVCTY